MWQAIRAPDAVKGRLDRALRQAARRTLSRRRRLAPGRLGGNLTITQLHIPASLTKTLFSTNPMESMNPLAAPPCAGAQERWSGAWPVQGHRELPLLVAALAVRTQTATEQAAKIA